MTAWEVRDGYGRLLGIVRADTEALAMALAKAQHKAAAGVRPIPTRAGDA